MRYKQRSQQLLLPDGLGTRLLGCVHLQAPHSCALSASATEPKTFTPTLTTAAATRTGTANVLP